MKYIAVSLFVIPASMSMPNRPQSSFEELSYLGQNNGYISNEKEGDTLVRRRWGWSGKGWSGKGWFGGMKGMGGMFGSPKTMMMMGMMGMGANMFGGI